MKKTVEQYGLFPIILFEQGAAHGFELPDLIAEDRFRKLKMFRKAGNAEECFSATVDHLAGERDVILQ